MQRTSVVGRAFLLVASVLASLTAAEIVVRSVGLAPPVARIKLGAERSAYRLSDNPVLGYELRPGFQNDEPNGYERITTNSHGQRDTERSLEKPPGTYRILLLGDSVVIGHGIRDVGRTISGQLERQLRHLDVEVLNFGVGGYSTRAEVELLRVKGVAFDPDLVVVVFLENDYLDFNNRIKKYRFQRPQLVNWLFLRSHLFRALALELDLFRLRDQVDPGYRQQWNQAAIGENSLPAALAMLKQLTREHGFDAFIAIWPDFTPDAVVDDPEDLPEGLEREHPDEMVVERLARRAGLETERLGPFFRRDLARRTGAGRPRDYYTRGDGMHPNEEGARVAAAALAQIITRRQARTSEVEADAQ